MGLSNAWLGALSIASGIASFVSYPAWGRWSEKHGNMKILAVGVLGHMLFPLLYGRSRSPMLHLVVHIIQGFAGAGRQLGFFNGLLDISPASTRPAYIATYNVTQGLSAFVWPFLGVWIYERIGMTPTLDLVFLIRLVTMSFAGYLLFGRLTRATKARTQATG
ncbi:MAG: MFS transporter [Bacillota bacterium]